MSSVQPAALPEAGSSRTGIYGAIRQASVRTETDFDFLLAQAQIESALNPTAKSKTSSAEGLYQFINQTWLETLDRHGAEHGYGWAANAISIRDGRATISDPALRQQVMQLRLDPVASSLMAGELARDNAAQLQQSLGREADHSELYLAHFLGASGAKTFITTHAAAPDTPAAELFPESARANRSVFYDNGRARSVGELREFVVGKLEAKSDLPVTASAGNFNARSFEPPHTVAALPQQSAQSDRARPSMAELLRQTFEVKAGASSPREQPSHVNRAYKNIARFGL